MKLKRELGAMDAADLLVDGPRTKRRKRGSSPTSASANEDVEMTNGNGNGAAGTGKAGNESVKEVGLRIWNAVRNAKGKDDRNLAHEFMRLPSKRQYADYYKLINRPIALDEIKAQLDSCAYPSIDAVKQDFDTCFRNAKRYNMKESQIWKDAKTLHKLVSAEYKAITGEDDVDVVGSDDGGVGSDEDDDKGKTKGKPGRPPSLNRLLKTRMQKLVDKTDDTGRLITEDFMELPSKKMYPIYYKTIKKLMCFDMIFKRIKRKEYATTAEFATDVELVFSNAFTFNEEHSPIWEDANTLKRYFGKLMSDLPVQYALPEYSPTTHHAPAQNGKLKLRVPAPSQVHATSSNANASLTVKLPATAKGAAQPQAAHTNRQVAHPVIKSSASRSPNLATRPSPQTHVSNAQMAPQPSSSYLHPATFSNIHPHQPQPQYHAHSQATSQTQSATHSISPSPLPPTPTPPTFDHPLRSVTLRTTPLGRTLKLDSSEGVRTWVLRLGRGETALDIRDVRFLEIEESEDEDEEEEEDESRSGSGSGHGKGEIIVKVNGSSIDAKVPNTKEGEGLWEVTELKNGTNMLEVGESGGEIWKVVLQRIGMKP